MTPEKRALIKQFVENKPLFDAVHEAMIAGITGSKLDSYVIGEADMLMDDAMYGQHVRARAKAVGMVRNGFAQLHQIASGSEGVQLKQNEAR